MNGKTNAMRILDSKKIPYTMHEYDGLMSAAEVAAVLGQDPEKVFKTLVTDGGNRTYFVFVIPVEETLDLKKAAKAAGEKSVAMIHVSEINALTGYVRGGCSPIGMRKQYKTFYNETALSQETIMVSAGKIGYQVELSPDDLIKLTRGKTADLVV